MVEDVPRTAESNATRSGLIASPRRGIAFIVSCAVLALIKLWMVRGDEAACLGSPFDDIWYVQSAKDWYSLRVLTRPAFRDAALHPPARIPPLPGGG